MSFQIERGLFLLDFVDYHAILGVSVEADVKEIRKNYLKIARRLHPDSCAAESESDKQLAERMLSKLVNPGWEKLSQEKSRTDHLVLLKLKGQSAARKLDDLTLMSGLAKQMLTSKNADYFYRTALQDLAERQYQHLDQTIELTAQISELNLAYLIVTQGTGEKTTGGTKKTTFTSTASASKTPAKAEELPKETLADQYYRRAEGFLAKGNCAQAVIELRDALKTEPNNSKCHSLMGLAYLRQNQPTMAKIHFNKALSINPQDPIALEGKQKLEPSTAKPEASGTAKNTAAKANPPKPNSGLFGGLFGKKK